MTTTATDTLGPLTRAALLAPVLGSKRKKVVVCIAVYLDSGRPDPSIGEIGERTGLSRQIVVSIVDRLERDGLLEVRRGDSTKEERNRYVLHLRAGTMRGPAA